MKSLGRRICPRPASTVQARHVPRARARARGWRLQSAADAAQRFIKNGEPSASRNVLDAAFRFAQGALPSLFSIVP